MMDLYGVFTKINAGSADITLDLFEFRRALKNPWIKQLNFKVNPKEEEKLF